MARSQLTGLKLPLLLRLLIECGRSNGELPLLKLFRKTGSNGNFNNHNRIKYLEEKGYATFIHGDEKFFGPFKRKGKRTSKYYSLTEKGKKLAEQLEVYQNDFIQFSQETELQ